MSHAKKSDVPHDRLTRICDAMTETLEAHPEYQEDKDQCIIFMDSNVEGVGGLVLHGWKHDADAVGAIFSHLQAIFQANGSELRVIPLPGRG